MIHLNAQDKHGIYLYLYDPSFHPILIDYYYYLDYDVKLYNELLLPLLFLLWY